MNASLEKNHAVLQCAQDLLLTPFSLTEQQLFSGLQRISLHQVDYADLFFQYTRSESWSIEDGIIKSGSFHIDQGLGVRAITDDKTAFAYSDEISQQALNEAADTVKTVAAFGASTHIKIQANPSFNLSPEHNLYTHADPLASFSAEQKIALLNTIDQNARARDPRITQVMASIAAEYDVILVARGDGLIAADIRPLVRISLSVIAEQNGRREIGSSGGGGRYDYHYFSDELLTRYIYEATHSALIQLEARPTPAGTMTVVLGPGWPGILLHEAIGHGLEGDFNRKGSSAFSGKIGQQVAAQAVTVVDDGTLDHRRGSLNIDDEGNPTQYTTLIEKGILKQYMQDSLNARLMKMPLTGNGRRESYACLPLPRMTNTYMLNGDKDPQEIIESVKNGLYAVNFSGGQVDITNGKFAFSASEAYLIENGKITTPVKGATLIGDGATSLKEISMVGNDLALDGGVGTCGKEGQSVPVGVGQPTLRIDQMTVGGTA